MPILGGAAVIGGKRLRLFNDGRPTVSTRQHISQPVVTIVHSPSLERVELNLPERPSPDGGEDNIEIPESTAIPEEDLDSWSDWDQEETNNQHIQEHLNDISPEISLTTLETENILQLEEKLVPRQNEIVTDILTLDIKSQKNVKMGGHDLDFFSDMEPVIEKTYKVFIDEKDDQEVNNINLTMTNAEDNLINEDCWGDDLSWVKD